MLSPLKQPEAISETAFCCRIRSTLGSPTDPLALYLCQALGGAPWFYWWSQTSDKCLRCTAHAFQCSWWASLPLLAPLALHWSAGRAQPQIVARKVLDRTNMRKEGGVLIQWKKHQGNAPQLQGILGPINHHPKTGHLFNPNSRGSQWIHPINLT